MKGKLGGIVQGKTIDIFYHDIHLYVATEVLKIRAGFSRDFSSGGILGRNGFFDYFQVTFDHAANPPSFELKKIRRDEPADNLN